MDGGAAQSVIHRGTAWRTVSSTAGRAPCARVVRGSGAARDTSHKNWSQNFKIEILDEGDHVDDHVVATTCTPFLLDDCMGLRRDNGLQSVCHAAAPQAHDARWKPRACRSQSTP